MMKATRMAWTCMTPGDEGLMGYKDPCLFNVVPDAEIREVTEPSPWCQDGVLSGTVGTAEWWFNGGGGGPIEAGRGRGAATWL